MILEFSQEIFKKYSNIKFHEICQVGAELFYVDRWIKGHMNTMKLIVAFCNFANVPNNDRM